MKIERFGSGAYHGVSTTKFRPPDFRWNTDHLEIRGRNVPDFNTQAHHDYVISIAPDELGSLVRSFADAAMQDPATLSPHIKKLLGSLMQLQAVGAGIVRP